MSASSVECVTKAKGWPCGNTSFSSRAFHTDGVMTHPEGFFSPLSAGLGFEARVGGGGGGAGEAPLLHLGEFVSESEAKWCQK